MKFLKLTHYNDDTEVYIAIDKIEKIYEKQENTFITFISGNSLVVKENLEWIVEQLYEIGAKRR